LLSKNIKINIYRTIILPVVLYECETWSVTLREELWLRVFEDRVLRRILGTKKERGNKRVGKLGKEELNDLYFSPNIVGVIKSRRMKQTGHVAHKGARTGLYRVLVGET
jgi:hypothetical protein